MQPQYWNCASVKERIVPCVPEDRDHQHPYKSQIPDLLFLQEQQKFLALQIPIPGCKRHIQVVGGGLCVAWHVLNGVVSRKVSLAL